MSFVRSFNKASGMQVEVQAALGVADRIAIQQAKRIYLSKASLIREESFQIVIRKRSHRDEFGCFNEPETRAHNNPTLHNLVNCIRPIRVPSECRHTLGRSDVGNAAARVVRRPADKSSAANS